MMAKDVQETATSATASDKKQRKTETAQEEAAKRLGIKTCLPPRWETGGTVRLPWGRLGTTSENELAPQFVETANHSLEPRTVVIKKVDGS